MPKFLEEWLEYLDQDQREELWVWLEDTDESEVVSDMIGYVATVTDEVDWVAQYKRDLDKARARVRSRTV